MKYIMILIAFLFSACESDLETPASTAKSTCASDYKVSILSGDQVPSIEKLVADGKFDDVSGELTSKNWPRPKQMRIDNIIEIRINEVEAFESAAVRLKKMGFTLVNSHEAVWYATAFPQKLKGETLIELLYSKFETEKGGKFISLDESELGRRIASQTYDSGSMVSKNVYLVPGVKILVHTPTN